MQTTPFKQIYVEICGQCEAGCKYCPTGVKSHNTGSFIDLDLFEKIIKKLVDKGIYQKGTNNVCLCNWGEPLMHPNFDEILKIINKYDISYTFSTNGALLSKLDVNEEFYKNLSYMNVSLCGFSQKSYDRVCDLRFSEVRQNIEHLADKLNMSRVFNRLGLSYHIYQFNLEEIEPAIRFSRQINAGFNAFYAFIIDYWQQKGLHDNTWNWGKWREVASDIILGDTFNSVENNKSAAHCNRIGEELMVNEHGQLATCCCLPNNHPSFVVGDFIKDDTNKLLKEKGNMAYCKECLAKGYHAYWSGSSASGLVNDMISNANVGTSLATAIKVKGFYNDSWLEPSSKFVIKTGPSGKIKITGYYPFAIDGNQEVCAYIKGGGYRTTHKISTALFSFELAAPKNRIVDLYIDTNFSNKADNADDRNLAFVLTDVDCQ
ncbi:MAG: radical SAM protein [Deferribacterales bacterium]|nr:radical SAM protein [Deferribacterales bacterium]